MGDCGTDDPTRQAERTGRAPSEGRPAGSPEYTVLPEPKWLPMGYVAARFAAQKQQFPEESKPQYSSRYPVWLFVNISAIMSPSSEPFRSLHVGGCDGDT